ncbi:MAG: UDP-N-acetylmuramate--L-alanine ligase [Ferruginibacter sp.]
MNNNTKIEEIIKSAPFTEGEGSVYFLGIGGIGMSVLARFFKSRGTKVSGYDKTPTLLTAQLESEGIPVHFEDNIELADKNAAFIVYTPALPQDHKELNFFKQNDFTLLKRSEVLGLITHGFYNICVAGTHGKTTTSAMIAHMLRHSGYGCNAFLGGIAANYETNFWNSENNVSVTEADEYDRSFLKLSPDVAVITSMDADHLDIYGTEENMQDAFISFTGKIKSRGLLINKYGLQRAKEFKGDNKTVYSLVNKEADARAENIETRNGYYSFDAIVKENTIKDVQLFMGGRHNIENTIACITVAKHLNISDDKIKDAVATFKGVKRRFEYVLHSNEHVMIDDYAHHPEELRALITSAKELFPEKKCTVIFQPHLFSRTQDLAKEFSLVLGLADEIILLPIYPAREKPIEGVNSEMLLEQMRPMNKKVMNKKDLLMEIKQSKPALLIVAGAGDIDTMVEPLKEILINR